MSSSTYRVGPAARDLPRLGEIWRRKRTSKRYEVWDVDYAAGAGPLRVTYRKITPSIGPTFAQATLTSWLDAYEYEVSGPPTNAHALARERLDAYLTGQADLGPRPLMRRSVAEYLLGTAPALEAIALALPPHPDERTTDAPKHR